MCHSYPFQVGVHSDKNDGNCDTAGHLAHLGNIWETPRKELVWWNARTFLARGICHQLWWYKPLEASAYLEPLDIFAGKLSQSSCLLFVSQLHWKSSRKTCPFVSYSTVTPKQKKKVQSVWSFKVAGFYNSHLPDRNRSKTQRVPSLQKPSHDPELGVPAQSDGFGNILEKIDITLWLFNSLLLKMAHL